MLKRWLIYAAIGLCFGVGDWYFMEGLAVLSQDQEIANILSQPPAVMRVLLIISLVGINYGAWLIPIIPAAVYEMKCTRSIGKAASSSVLIWVTALMGYYGYYTLQLMGIGLPNLDFMLYANHANPDYWTNWWPPFRRIILDQFVEWIWIAMIGGFSTGAASAIIYNRFSLRHPAQGG